jgi:hypothetical protein
MAILAEIFRGFLQSPTQIPGQYLKSSKITSFHILSNSLTILQFNTP